MIVVTEKCQIAKALVGAQKYFIMDTPGFDPENEQKTFIEIVRGIEAVAIFARFAGILYLSCINQPRFDDFDRKLVNFVHALSGDEYRPRLTFVTTFWTAAGSNQQASFNNRLEMLKSQWLTDGDEHPPQLYQHGRQYDPDGTDTKRFLDWFESRDQIARHGKDMIARHYGSSTEGETDNITPRIGIELKARTPLHSTTAGMLLGLTRPNPSGMTPAPGELPDHARDGTQSQSSHWQRPEPAPQRDPNTAAQDEPDESWASWLLHWARQNITFSVELGRAGAGVNIGPRPRPEPGFRPFAMNRGEAALLHLTCNIKIFDIFLDPNSVVDQMNFHGLDSSREGRLRYAERYGISGDLFSADWNTRIRRDVQRRYR